MPSAPEMNLYEYSVIRYVPRVEREEFINIGLIMMCKRRRWLRVSLYIDRARISALCPDADIETLEQQAASFEAIAASKSGRFGAMAAEERFRWLTAVRSACLSTSRPHPGTCHDLDDTFSHIMAQMVL